MSGVAKAVTAALAARSTQNWGYVASRSNNTMSVLGTPQAPHLPPWLTDNPMPQGKPWGPMNQWTNYYTTTPNTGVTRYYDWTVSKIPCAPDGVALERLAVNNQVPGPTIEANWGDWFEIKVTNNLTDEGTAIHWHGMLQKGTPWMDGVPGFTQCPIAPGSTFTYRFQADLYGTSWWHSHYSSQYASGLAGPMVIYGPNQTSYDADLGPVMVSDWYHQYYEEVIDALFAPLPAPNIPMSDNNLINGKNSFDCSTTSLPCTPDAPLASFNFTSGKLHRIRFINPSAAATQKITIDGHSFTVIANDFVEIVPYETDILTLAVGQRTDVIVKATGSPSDAVWMRAYKPPLCWPSHGGNEVKAAIFYENADRSQAPTSSAGPNAYNTYCGNDPLDKTVPLMPVAAGEPSVTEVLPLEFKSNGTNLLWYMANRTFRVNYNDPILLETKLGNLNLPYIENVHNYGTNASLRFIVENTGPQPHPMHMHGHNMFILAEGNCSSNSTVFGNDQGASQDGHMSVDKRAAGQYGNCWDGTITRPENPQRRDVHMLLPGQFIVVQWNQDNPGAWSLHCHIAWHLSAGFVWTVIEQPDSVRNEMQVPSIMAQTCRDWSTWTGDHVVAQIDDGL
ncbi:hypothetical protein BAUCODRAFT_136452 [Baudoinia panamericana UAMH 10762]|uniref:Multicopper oxidase n=1 Tax=Baudoinia panamericana (strain UAMH 10762) TaxID=717646 RepID=M2NKE3_BAUPA|nr:uncharacterized protein BAUCODRAFT_136452 [Baudoinia panamericana UAMH 10762]EMC99909.1 hypothetical protein BAUCODRAFT_136452 [Baudoinia panamericana UAMH 10762]